MWRETGIANGIASAVVDFNPLPPCGGRLEGKYDDKPEGGISIHSLRVEGDAKRCDARREWIISIHSLRVEGDVPAADQRRI